MSSQSFKEPKPLREFLDGAHNNTKATEQNKNELFKKLDDINMAFAYLNSLLDFTSDWFLVFFVLRSHSSFLAAATLSASTQLPDSYSGMRSVLENALYGFFLWKHKDLIDPWLRRQENDKARQRVRNEFKYGNMMRELKATSDTLGKMFETLYNDTIDYGAHPNVASVISNIKQISEEDTITHVLKYFNADSPYLDLSLKHLCRIGLLALHIFGIIWNDRLKLTDYSQTLERLKKGL